ncbi:MAG: hypothetical protein ACF8CQ_24175 [Rhodopirellula sp. JB044]|uniref:hypothetical protein n=1 Tax=Rhodopirellula sp. JB044 TaxID=3342844 RepID=UPI00370C1D93
MHGFSIFLVALGAGIVTMTGCSPESGSGQAKLSARPLAKRGHDRLLGFGVTEGSVGYEVAFGEAQKAGIQFIELPQQWDDIESAPEVYNSPFLIMANEVYPAFDTGIVLSLNPIDTSALRLPAHLAGKAFDDAEVVSAFMKVVDFTIAGLPDAKIVAISIGNEVDGNLANDGERWAQYTRFFAEVREHIRTKLPGVPVGVKTTYSAIMGSQRHLIGNLNSSADAVMVTYYPLDAEFNVRPPSLVDDEIGKLVSLAAGKPVHLLETGYPSGAANGSSEALQAEFVRNIFEAWEKYADDVPLVNIVWLYDMSADEVATLTKYYSVETPAFAGFLGTLGLKTHSGEDKQAFFKLLEYAKESE